jgi:methylglyoxal reductase
MRTEPLGQSGVEASVVGLGTWAIGGIAWGGTDEQESIAAIRAGIDAGITLIDTAPGYGRGLSEELIGQAVEGRRDRVILATKCGLVWWDTKGEFFFGRDDVKVYRYLGPESVRYELEQSLTRLGVDCIDLYQTHWQDPTTPVEDTMAELLSLKDQGKIRAIGVSNATTEHMDAYRSVGPLDTAQEQYSMLDRRLEAENLPYCREHGIGVLAYSPLALGLLTGKIDASREFKGDDLRQGNPRFARENREKVQAMLAEFLPIAAGYGLSVGQLVIAWTVRQPGLTHALVGARNPRQALENAGAGKVSLADTDLLAMNSIIAEHAPGIR